MSESCVVVTVGTGTSAVPAARETDAADTKGPDAAAGTPDDADAFTGPVASFNTAEGFREMAAQAGPMVTRFSVRRQFTDGDTVCSIIDWEMALPIAAMTSAEMLEVRDGQIVRGELIYDAQELRSAMAAGA